MATSFVSNKHFFGSSKIFGGERDALTHMFRQMARMQAKTSVLTVSPLSMTDNSGGTVDRTMVMVPKLTPASLGSSDCVTKVAAEAAFATAVVGLGDIAARLEALRAKVPVSDTAFVNNLGSSATTIAAITQTFSGASSALVSAAGAISVLSAIAVTQQQLAYWVNKFAVAVGVDEHSGTFGVTGYAASVKLSSFGQTFAAIPVATGNAATGTLDTVKVADMQAAMAIVANNVADLAAVLNDVTAGSVVPLVIAS